MAKGKIRIAFTFIDGERWTAGTYYLKNLFTAIRAIPTGDQPELVLIVSEKTPDTAYAVFDEFIDEVIKTPATHNDKSIFCKALDMLSTKLSHLLCNREFAQFLLTNNIDLFFTRGAPPANLRTPVLSWIPDFQHIHYPEFFSHQERASRDVSAANASERGTLLVLSSKAALEDYQKVTQTSNMNSEKGRVLSFVAQIPGHIYNAEPANVCGKYFLPQKFFLLPNQFWKHKNHITVIEALAIAAKENPDITVVCTGNTNEYRDDQYFSKLLCMISEKGVRQNMILLGLVPRDDLFSLMRQSLAVVQPSLFEGWNTAIEEAKSLGKQLLISDIPVHKEQGQNSVEYFKPTDAKQLGQTLISLHEKYSPGPDSQREEEAKKQLLPRTVAFGENFMQIAQEAVGRYWDKK